MTKEIDLEKLPEEARKELLDFYEFLLEKYGKKKKNRLNIEKLLPKKVKFFDPLNRDDIYER